MLRVWTKKLGQRHYTRDGMSETLCGVPMLGNNYAGIIPENEQKECEKCVAVLKKEGTKETVDTKVTYEKIMGEIEDRLQCYKKGALDLDVALFDIVDIIKKYRL